MRLELAVPDRFKRTPEGASDVVAITLLDGRLEVVPVELNTQVVPRLIAVDDEPAPRERRPRGRLDEGWLPAAGGAYRLEDPAIRATHAAESAERKRSPGVVMLPLLATR